MNIRTHVREGGKCDEKTNVDEHSSKIPSKGPRDPRSIVVQTAGRPSSWIADRKS